MCSSSAKTIYSAIIDAKMLYGLLLDRMHLSFKNGWVDKQGRVYQFFTVKEAQGKLSLGHEKMQAFLRAGTL